MCLLLPTLESFEKLNIVKSLSNDYNLLHSISFSLIKLALNKVVPIMNNINTNDLLVLVS